MAKSKILGVIGFGNMASAIVEGLLKNKIHTKSDIIGLQHSAKTAKKISKDFGVKFEKDIQKFMNKADVILLAVKPQQLKEVLEVIKPYYKKQLILSVIAGINVSTYEKILGKAAPIVRTMPNTPALVGYGATGIFSNNACKATQVKMAEKVFSSVGMIVSLAKEKQIDAVIAVSGSGPAFIFHYSEAVISVVTKLGLPKKVVKALLIQTLKGAAELMEKSNDEPSVLREKVTSKGGTTQAGLDALKKNKFSVAVDRCAKATYKRAGELSKLFG